MPIFGSERAGKGSRVLANGTPLANSEWNADLKRDRLDTTNFESGGRFQGLTGIESVDVDSKGYWNAALPQSNDPPGIFPQDFYPNLLLYENVSDGTLWDFPLFLIDSAKNSSSVRGLVEFSFSGCSNGDFSIP